MEPRVEAAEALLDAPRTDVPERKTGGKGRGQANRGIGGLEKETEEKGGAEGRERRENGRGGAMRDIVDDDSNM